MSADTEVELPTLEEILAAKERIAGRAHRTPLLRSSQVDKCAGAELFFKCENFQKVGAFKFRGACNAVFALDPAQPVATHSSGNHGQALALAAQMRGVPCHVVMPIDAPKAKKAAVRGYGATIVDCEPTLKAREEKLAEVVVQTGARFVHPYNDPLVVAGQATTALEIFEQQEDIDTIMVPVGGGGLMAGSCLAVAYTRPDIEVVGAEPKLADDAAESLKKGVRQPPRPPVTVADGLRTALGPLSFAVAQKHLKTIHLVEEEAILEAMRFVWERMKLVIEPSSAVPVAAAFAGALTGRRAAVVLTGGNLDLDRLPWQKSA